MRWPAASLQATSANLSAPIFLRRWDKQTIYFIGHTQLGKDTYIKERLYFDQFVNTLFAYNNSTYTTQNPPQGFQSYYNDYTLGGSLEFGTKLGDKNTLKAALHGKFDRHKEHNQGAAFYTFEDTTYSLGLEDTHQFTSRFSVTAGASYDRRSFLQAVNTNTGATLGGKTFTSLNPQIGLFYKLLKSAGVPFGEQMRGPAMSLYVVVIAADGYQAVYALPELDPLANEGPVILAEQKNGQPLDAASGPLRIILPKEKRHARWVRKVIKIEVRRAAKP